MAQDDDGNIAQGIFTDTFLTAVAMTDIIITSGSFTDDGIWYGKISIAAAGPITVSALNANTIRAITATGFDTITIIPNTATQVRIETAANGSGTQVTSESVAAGSNMITVYAITRDTYGNFVANDTVTWSVPANLGAVAPSSGTYTIFTATTVANTSGNLTATHALGSPVVAINVTPNVLAKFVVDVPSSGVAGQSFTITLTARDQYDNTTTNVSGITTITAVGMQDVTVAGSSFSTNGIASTSGTITKAGTSVLITATNVNGSTGTANINITPASANNYTRLQRICEII